MAKKLAALKWHGKELEVSYVYMYVVLDAIAVLSWHSTIVVILLLFFLSFGTRL